MDVPRVESWKSKGLWVWLLMVSAVAACLVALQASPATSQTVTTLTVDDNGAQCTEAEFTTIQAAVDAAVPGTRIVVCAGTYEEQVTVGAGKNDLVLDGSGRASTTIKAPDSLTGAGDIITVTGSRRVQIQDFEITGPLPNSCSPEYLSGIRVYGGGSANIANNHITGIRTEDVDFRGCQNGFGVVFGDYDSATQASTSGDGTVVNNTIDRYQKGGVVVSEEGSNVAVLDNDISGVGESENIAQNGIQVSYGGQAIVRLNNIEDNVYTGAEDDLYDAGGIILAGRPDNDTLVGTNTVSNNDYNIGLFNADGILFRNNQVTNSTDLAGIFVNAQSKNNVFEDNRALNNQRFDCRDRSLGTRTAGTANTWTNNVGEIDRPDGICRPPQ